MEAVCKNKILSIFINLKRVLIFQSLNIGNIMYKVDWYNLEADLQKDLLLVIIRSRKPVYLRAGPFGPITYSTISTVGGFI